MPTLSSLVALEVVFRLSLWQPPVPPVMTKLASWQLSGRWWRWSSSLSQHLFPAVMTKLASWQLFGFSYKAVYLKNHMDVNFVVLLAVWGCMNVMLYDTKFPQRIMQNQILILHLYFWFSSYMQNSRLLAVHQKEPLELRDHFVN